LLEQELTWAEAAALLERVNDAAGRKLKAMVLAREKQTRKPIAIRLAGNRRPKLRVTLSAIRRSFPEMRAAHEDGLALSLRHVATQLREHHDARTKKLIQDELEGDLGPRVRKLEKRLGLAERYLADLHALEKKESTRNGRTGRNG
jgi:hypothetical protein